MTHIEQKHEIEDDEVYGPSNERIHIEIDWLKKSVHGRWEYAVWRGEEQLVLGWRDTLDEVATSVNEALKKAGVVVHDC